MTREEAIQVLSQRPMIAPNKSNKQKMFEEAIDMAIEALKDRPQGEWIARATTVGDKEYIEYSRCSECGELALVRMNYCPHCGAYMRGDNNG